MRNAATVQQESTRLIDVVLPIASKRSSRFSLLFVLFDSAVNAEAMDQLRGSPSAGPILGQPSQATAVSGWLGDCANHLARTIPFWAEMSGKQQSCLISFAWNLGQDF